MIIKWLGHSCFLFTSDSGTRILTDPPDDATGYAIEPVCCDAVTVSHHHHDHDNMSLATGAPEVMDAPGEYEVKGVTIRGVRTFHDGERGALRGENTVFIYDIDGIKVVHAGDLGAIPDKTTLGDIGAADVLLVPIGGVYTIDAAGAQELANLLHPKVLIPMHYKTGSLSFDLEGLRPFIDIVKDCNIHCLREDECTLSRDSLGTDRVIALNYGK